MDGWTASHANHRQGHETIAGTATTMRAARIRGRRVADISAVSRLSPPRATSSAQRFLFLRSATRATRTRSQTPMAMCMVAPMSAAPNMRTAVSIGRAWEIQAGRSVYERHNHVCWILMPGRTILRTPIPFRCAHATFPALGMSRLPSWLSSHVSREARGPGDIRLHSTARQRLDASSNREGLA